MSLLDHQRQSLLSDSEKQQEVENSEQVVKNDPTKNSVSSSVFVLCATTLGAGILSLPYAFKLVGIVLGIILLLLVGIASAYAIRILTNAAYIARARSYEELGEVALPNIGGKLVAATTLVLIFGSLTAFLIIIGDTVTPAFQSLISLSSSSPTPFYATRDFLIAFILFVLCYPMSLLRSIHALEKVAKLAVGIILLFSLLVFVLTCNSWNHHEIRWSQLKLITFNSDFFEALPIISLAFTCQTMVFPLWRDLNTPTRTRMRKVVHSSLTLSGTLYTIVGIFGYMSWSIGTSDDALDNLGAEPFYQAVRCIFAIAIIIHYPVVHYAFRDTLLRSIFNDDNANTNSTTFVHVCATTVTVGFTCGAAILVPKLSAVFSFTGALCAFPYCFILPPIYYLQVNRAGFVPPTHTFEPEIAEAEEEEGLFRSNNNNNVVLPPFTQQASQSPELSATVVPVPVSVSGFVPAPVSVDSSGINLTPLIADTDINNQGTNGLSVRERTVIFSLLIGSIVVCIVSVVVTAQDMVKSLNK